MKTLDHRLYGDSPYSLILVHGGPGAPGTLAPLARDLGSEYGVIEALQTSTTLQGQIDELHTLITDYSSKPVTLLGHSWGAWLTLLYTHQYPEAVEKILLVGAGPFTQEYTVQLSQARNERLDQEERIRFQKLIKSLQNEESISEQMLHELDALLFVTDNYQLIIEEASQIEHIPVDVASFQGVWQEAVQLRKSGELLNRISEITVPVMALHGDYDPHPTLGVKLPLEQILPDFNFMELKQCGHNPWLEKQTIPDFMAIVRKACT